MSLKRGVLLLAKYSGLFALARMITARKTRILAYHGIWLGEGQFGNFLYMDADKFASRMVLLDKLGYPVVPLDTMVGETRCATVITIDDGWYGSWTAMLPALEEHNYPATIYLATYYCLNQQPVVDVALQYCFHRLLGANVRRLHLPSYDFGPMRVDSDLARKDALSAAQKLSATLEGDRERQQFLRAICEAVGIDHSELVDERWFHLMNPAEVSDAANRGVTFECHTHRHRITEDGKDSLAAEIAINSEHIYKLTGRRPEHFCYPSGQFSPDLWPALADCHMESATTTDIGLVDKNTPKYAMPRILDGQNVTELELEAELSGFMELSRVLRRVGYG